MQRSHKGGTKKGTNVSSNAAKGKRKGKNAHAAQKFSTSRITLRDKLPSAIAVRVECHKVLWAMVSLIGEGGKKEEGPEMSVSDAQDEVEERAPKKRRRDRFGINDNVGEDMNNMGKNKNSKYVRDERLIKMTGILLAEKDSRDMWYEHIYMMRHSGDGCLYPSRVEGVGPSSKQGSHTLMSFLGNPRVKFEVPRLATYLFPPTSEDLLGVKELFHEKYCDLPGVDRHLAPDDVHPKYWDQRYRLFHRFDRGVELDPESWYSITPEAIGVYLAKKVRNRMTRVVGQPLRVIIDAFSGCGGCAIPLATIALAGKKGKGDGPGENAVGHVVAVDTDKDKLDKLVHNAGIYDSTERIQVACEEVSSLLRTLPDLEENGDGMDNGGEWKRSVDLVVLSPPWGGPQYLNKRTFDLRNLPECCGCGLQLFELAASKCLNLAYIIPRNVPKAQLESLARSCLLKRGAQGAGRDDYLVEDVFLHGKHKVTILFIGPLFVSPKQPPMDIDQGV